MKILKAIQHFLVWARIVKHKGKNANGLYIAAGINRKNPLSYLAVLIASIFVGILAFYKEFVDTWRTSW